MAPVCGRADLIKLLCQRDPCRAPSGRTGCVFAEHRDLECAGPILSSAPAFRKARFGGPCSLYAPEKLDGWLTPHKCARALVGARQTPNVTSSAQPSPSATERRDSHVNGLDRLGHFVLGGHRCEEGVSAAPEELRGRLLAPQSNRGFPIIRGALEPVRHPHAGSWSHTRLDARGRKAKGFTLTPHAPNKCRTGRLRVHGKDLRGEPNERFGSLVSSPFLHASACRSPERFS
jgi:hypothetical protein